MILWALLQISTVVIPLTIGLLVTAALYPLAQRLCQAGLRPAAAAGLVLVAGIATLVGLITGIVILVIPQLDQLGTALQQGADNLSALLQRGPLGLPAIDLSDVAATARTNLAGGPLTPRVLSAATTAGHVVTELLVGIVAVFFYLKDGPRLTAAVTGLLPASWQPHVAAVNRRIWMVLTAYVRGQIVIALVDGFFIGAGLALLGVPLPLPLGAVVAVCALFPVIGAITGSLLAILVAFADGGVGLALAVLALAVVVFQLEAHVLSPWLLGRRVSLHPLVVVISLTLGGLLFGVIGALLAVPVAACLTQILDYARHGDTAHESDLAAARELRPPLEGN